MEGDDAAFLSVLALGRAHLIGRRLRHTVDAGDKGAVFCLCRSGCVCDDVFEARLCIRSKSGIAVFSGLQAYRTTFPTLPFTFQIDVVATPTSSGRSRP